MNKSTTRLHLKLLVLFICGLFQLQARGQAFVSPLKVNIIPPSPNSAALAKYVDFPVNQYTGIPQISLPLGAIGNKELSVPISLNYHAGGLKVEENASWVGLGWSLSGGGVITRTVRGLPDDLVDLEHLGFDGTRPFLQKYLNHEYNATDEETFLNRVAEGRYDTEPDQYFFNFQGKSGSVIFDADGKGTIMPYQNLKIERPDVDHFIIKDESGTIYDFWASEKTTNLDPCDVYPIPEFTSSWHLASIATPNGESVSFNYVVGVTYQDIIPEESSYNLLTPNTGCPGNPSSGCLKSYVINTSRLESIVMGKNKIKFIANTKRTDLPGLSSEYRLDAIEFLYNDQSVKKILLEYDIFGCNKLRLNQVKQAAVPSGSSSNLLYKFEYYDPNKVPCSISKSQDHWGFFNDNNSGTLLPKASYAAPSGSIVDLPGADRSPNFTATRTGVLNKITYPTGGFTQFDYQLNDYGFVVATKVMDWVEEPQTTEVLADNSNSYQEAQFEINTAQDVALSYKINVAQSGGNYPSINEYISLINVTTNAVVTTQSSGVNNLTLRLDPGIYKLVAYSENYATYTSASISYKSRTDNQIKTKPTGGIRIAKITDYDGLDHANDMVRNYKYTMGDEPSRSSGVISGDPKYTYFFDQMNYAVQCRYFVRIARPAPLGSTQGGNVGYREVTVERSNGAKSVYKYTSFYDFQDGINDGAPFPQPTSYDFLRGLLIGQSDYKTTNNNLVKVSETSNYYNVTESRNRQLLRSLKVSYKRRSDNPQVRVYFVSPYDFISQWVYQDSSKVVSYDMNGQNPVTTSKAFKYENAVHAQTTRIETTKSNGLKETELTTYPLDYASGTTFIDNMNTAHIVNYPIEKIKYTTNTLGDIKIIGGSITKYKTGGKGLKDEDQAIETAAPVALSAFKLSNRASSGILPPTGTAAVFSADLLYKGKLKVNLYDAKSNILEYQAVDGIKVSLIWDYDSSMPIAQAINAAQNDIAYTSFEAEGKGNWTFSGTPVVSGIAATGSLVYQLSSGALNKAGLTVSKTYTLSYRTKNTVPFSVAGTVGTATSVPLSGGWTLYEHQITGTTVVQLAGTGIIDEVRLYPSDASMSTYTYVPMVGTTSQTDAKGQTTYYEYDEFQRLKNVKDQNGNILKNNTYHYKP